MSSLAFVAEGIPSKPNSTVLIRKDDALVFIELNEYAGMK